MRNDINLYNKCQCKTCKHKKKRSKSTPCNTCKFICSDEGINIGNNHSDSKVSVFVLKKEIDLLTQRIEQLEFDRLTGCMCKNNIITNKRKSTNESRKKTYY